MNTQWIDPAEPTPKQQTIADEILGFPPRDLKLIPTEQEQMKEKFRARHKDND